jgi:hypothetical protein
MHTFWSEKPEGRGHLGELCADQRIILKQILKEQDVILWTGFI